MSKFLQKKILYLLEYLEITKEATDKEIEK
jgi:hypothetical protein